MSTFEFSSRTRAITEALEEAHLEGEGESLFVHRPWCTSFVDNETNEHCACFPLVIPPRPH